MVNDIAAVSPMNNLLVKYADDITISVSVRQSTDTAAAEVENMKKWRIPTRCSQFYQNIRNVHARQNYLVIPSRINKNKKEIMVKTIRSHILGRCYELEHLHRQYAIQS